MEKAEKRDAASREDWLAAALKVIHERGVESVKVVALARTLGLTSGSFYWHFKNIQDLLDSVLEYWENHLTSHIIEDARAFEGPPADRILALMKQVVREGAAVPDSSIAVWAKSDAAADAAYKRTIRRRFMFAAWMFRELGLEAEEAAARGRLMVTALMGEAANDIRSDPEWERIIEHQWEILVGRQ
ncbi:MAG: TetR/AcrR family transcriptional regulator [Dinoroseobacter sp.]|nr:TetR/AcrR family transcriptional regulator [Dinoroseobacter sp.]